MNILRNILKGTARPAVPRPVPMVPMSQHPARAQAVEVLELRLKEAMPFRNQEVIEKGYEPSPAPRALLMAAGRVRQAEDSKVAQLERELVMERLRTKELREQLLELSAQLTVLQEAGYSDLVEDYEGLSPDDVIPWVERVLLPAYGRAVAKLKGLSEPAQLAKVQLAPAGAWFFADVQSEQRFHQVRRGEILHGLIVIEGPPGSGKTVMGTCFAGRDSAQQWPTEQVMERTIRSDIGNVLFYDDIDTREPWYRGDVPQPGGETLHSHAIVEALTKKWPLMVILAGQHVGLSPEMQSLGTVNIRLEGGAE
jgi:hypothetical protein